MTSSSTEILTQRLTAPHSAVEETRVECSFETVPFHWEEFLDRCLGDVEFAKKAVCGFRKQFGQELGRLREAVSRQDAQDVERIAHMLKGAAATIAAKPITGLLRQLESLGREQDLETAPRQLHLILQEWERLDPALAELTNC